jgi:hypothetical protein
MRRENEWVLVLVTLILVLGVMTLALFWGWGVRGGCCSGWWPWGMMGHGMMTWGFTPWGWWGLFLMLLVPLGVLSLGILAVIWVLRGLSQSTGNTPGLRCPACQRSVQRDWTHCPHCGASLEH